MESIFELLSKQEELCDELKTYRSKNEIFELLQHPLVYAVPYTPQMNAFYNKQLQFKQEKIKEYEAKKEWHRVVGLYEKPYRFNYMEKLINEPSLGDKDYWEMLAWVWCDSENLHQIPNLSDFLNADRKHKKHMMEEDEKKIFNKLPSKVMIYRGHQDINQIGYSWTLSYSKAKFFSKRFYQKDNHISYALCPKDLIAAIFLSRNEYEIVVEDPNALKICEFEKIERSEFLINIHQTATREFKLEPRSDHGPDHWEKVERNTLILSKGMDEKEILTCRLFAILHDCKREDEFDDPEHGYRAARFVSKALEKPIRDSIGADNYKRLLEALRHHNEASISDDPVIGCCWDADRLDLLRVGIIPDKNLLSTKQGKKSIWKI